MQTLRNAIEKEITYRTSRSSGSGGQNVNKVETKVSAQFNVSESQVLDENQRARVALRLKNRINSDGILSVDSSETRSQVRNKSFATERLIELVILALKKKKLRKKTAIPESVKRKRLEDKKVRSEKKSRRGFNPRSLL